MDKMKVVDVSDPSMLRVVGKVTGTYMDVHVVGSYAYAATGRGLSVVDVSEPTAPVQVGAVVTDPSSWNAQSVHTSGDYAYVAHTGKLVVVDVSQPAFPHQVGVLDSVSNAWDLRVSGSYAYVADWHRGLVVVDVCAAELPQGNRVLRDTRRVGHRRGRAPRLRGRRNQRSRRARCVDSESASTGFNNRAHCFGLRRACRRRYGVRGRWLWSGTNRRALIRLEPRKVGTIETRGAFDLHFVGNVGYVAAGDAGLVIFEVPGSGLPRVVGRLSWQRIYGVYAAGSYVYAVRSSGLVVVDISNPAAPRPVGSISTGDPASNLVVDAFAFLAGGERGLIVIDVSNPAMPVEVAAVEDVGDADDVVLDGNIAYVAAGSDGLTAIDISVPTAPRLIGRLSCSDSALCSPCTSRVASPTLPTQYAAC